MGSFPHPTHYFAAAGENDDFVIAAINFMFLIPPPPNFSQKPKFVLLWIGGSRCTDISFIYTLWLTLHESCYQLLKIFHRRQGRSSRYEVSQTAESQILS